jgi:hypothetical protein
MNEPLEPEEIKRRLETVRSIVRVFDEALPIPGTNLRFGVDAVVGLVPVLGDVVGAGASIVVLVASARLGVPGRVLFAMAGNVGVEALVGIVPFFGDVFDVVFRANRRNLTLLEAYLRAQPAPRSASPWFVLSVAASAVLLLAFLAFAGVAVLAWALLRRMSA